MNDIDAAYEKANCEQKGCNDVVSWEIKNIRKDDTLCFCDLHFWGFCKKMDEYFDLFKEAIPEIKELLDSVDTSK